MKKCLEEYQVILKEVHRGLFPPWTPWSAWIAEHQKSGGGGGGGGGGEDGRQTAISLRRFRLQGPQGKPEWPRELRLAWNELGESLCQLTCSLTELEMMDEYMDFFDLSDPATRNGKQKSVYDGVDLVEKRFKNLGRKLRTLTERTDCDCSPM